MKGRKLLALLLAVVLVLGLAAAVAPAHAAFTFLAIDDELLPPGSAPYFSGGNAYVSYSIIGRFGIYYSYFENNTISLYTGSAQLYFDMANGGSYDANGNTYTASAVYVGGVPYVPVVFCASFFGGFGFSYLNSIGYGDVLRLTTGAQQLSDGDFINAAASTMMAYLGTPVPPVTPVPSPSPSESPSESPTPSPTPETDRSDTTVYLAVEGLPEAAAVNTLRARGLRCGFFLTAAQIRENPVLVNELAADGHLLGVACGDNPEAAWEETAPLLFEAAGVWPVLITCAPGSEAAAEALADARGLALWRAQVDGAAEEKLPGLNWYTSGIAACGKTAFVRLAADEEGNSPLSGLLRYLIASKYSMAPLRETVLWEEG